MTETRTLLPPETTSVGAARRFVEATLASSGRPELADAATLLTSELVTNAVLHAGTEVGVVVRVEGGGLRVEVHDASPVLPVVKTHSALAATGRGLHLVEKLADAWGVGEEDGKYVWFRLGAGRVGPAEPEAEVDLDAWADLEEEVPGAALVEVRILGLPLRVYARAAEHGDELFREFALVASRDPADDASVPARLLALVADLGRFSSFTAAAGADLQAALGRGDDEVDLSYRVPPEAAQAVVELDRLLDEAEAYCRSEDLLTLAAPPDALAFRRWYLAEFVRQAAGGAPRRWPGG